jgi:hypothetical protein
MTKTGRQCSRRRKPSVDFCCKHVLPDVPEEEDGAEDTMDAAAEGKKKDAMEDAAAEREKKDAMEDAVTAAARKLAGFPKDQESQRVKKFYAEVHAAQQYSQEPELCNDCSNVRHTVGELCCALHRAKLAAFVKVLLETQ